MFNLCVYVGAIATKDLYGALAAFFGLYLPCFFFILFILPFWETYRRQTKVKNVIAVICSASIGLILTAAVILYQN
jgi:chromate transport protein ChrA